MYSVTVLKRGKKDELLKASNTLKSMVPRDLERNDAILSNDKEKKEKKKLILLTTLNHLQMYLVVFFLLLLVIKKLPIKSTFVTTTNDVNLNMETLECDSFLSESGTFDHSSAIDFSSLNRDNWNFGFSTRLAVQEILSDLDKVKLIDNGEVKRGDLVLLCVNGLPMKNDQKERTFISKFTKHDGTTMRYQNGQLLVGVMGARYAPDAIHGVEQADLDVPFGEVTSILGGGGTYGKFISLYQPKAPLDYLEDEAYAELHPKMLTKNVPIQVIPIGRLTREDGRVYNIRDEALAGNEGNLTIAEDLKGSSSIENMEKSNELVAFRKTSRQNENRNFVPIYVFTGVSMNSGKSNSMAHFIRGLEMTGLVVGATKITGTDYPKDLKYFMDSGASFGCTFADFGVSSTYGLPNSELDRIADSAIGRLLDAGSEVIVVELADGVRAPEAKYLLGKSEVFRSRMTSIIVAANSGLGAFSAVDEIYRIGLGDKLGGVTGVMTSAPLASEEFKSLENDTRLQGRSATTLVFNPSEAATEKFAKSFLDRWPAYHRSA